MKTKLVITLIVITLLSKCSASVISQSAISSILQDIMSPANTEKAMQLINMAATRANKNIVIPTAVIASNDCGMPARTNEMPATVFVRNDPVKIVNGLVLPRVITTNDGTRFIARESRVLNPEFMFPTQQEVARQVVRESPGYAANMIDLRQLYQTAPVALQQENIGCPCRSSMPNPYLPVGISSNSYLPIAKPANSYLPVAALTPNSYLPTSIPNPYLPAASSLSTMSTSPLPPPTQSKGQFLRKIPMPPPML